MNNFYAVILQITDKEMLALVWALPGAQSEPLAIFV